MIKFRRKNIGPKGTANRLYRPKGLVVTYQWAEELHRISRQPGLTTAERGLARRCRDRAEAWGLAEDEHSFYWRLSGMSRNNPDHTIRSCRCGFDRCSGLAAYKNPRSALSFYGRSYLEFHAKWGVNSLTRNAAREILEEINNV